MSNEEWDNYEKYLNERADFQVWSDQMNKYEALIEKEYRLADIMVRLIHAFESDDIDISEDEATKSLLIVLPQDMQMSE